MHLLFQWCFYIARWRLVVQNLVIKQWVNILTIFRLSFAIITLAPSYCMVDSTKTLVFPCGFSRVCNSLGMDVSVNINVPLLRLEQNRVLMSCPNLLQICREDDQIRRELGTAASQLVVWTQRVNEEMRDWDWSTGKQLFIQCLVSDFDYILKI